MDHPASAAARQWAQDPRILACGLTAGVLGVIALPALPSLPWLAAAFLLALWPWALRAPLLAAVLGAVLCAQHGQAYLDSRWPAARHGDIIDLQAVVASIPERQPAADGATYNWRFEVVPAAAGEPAPLPERLRVSWYRTSETPSAGECWQFRLRMRTPHGSVNPHGFDYEAWLMRARIGALATVREARRCEGAGAGPLPVQRLRQHWVDRLRDAAGETRATAVMTALTVGDTSALADADWTLLRDTGTTHLVAISGFNLGIVAAVILLLVRWLWSCVPPLCLRIPAQRAALVAAVIVCGGYALLAGFEAPVLRALLMLWVVMIAALCHRLHAADRALAWAWIAILVIDPLALLAPGLWLSFGAVLAIFFATLGRWRAPRAWRVALQVQLVLSLALVPLGLWFFDGTTWLSPLVNLIAVPIFAVLTPAVLLATAALALDLPAGAGLAQQLALVVEVGLQGLDALVAASPSPWLSAVPPRAALWLGLIGAIVLCMPRGLPGRGLAVPCLLALGLPREVPVAALQLTALDVGQGTAVVVRTRTRTLLYDAGPAHAGGFDAGRSIVVPHLLSQGIGRLDVLLQSHDDNDHAGGVGAVRGRLRVDRQLGGSGEPCVAGMQWTWDGVDFRILHPPAAAAAPVGNDDSCVLRIEGPFSVLLAGDIGREAERALLREARLALRAEVLLTPHHGSRSSSSRDFVAAVDPVLAIHSAAWRSRYGHPHPRVQARYRQQGSEQRVTGVVGAVTVVPEASGGVTVSTARAQQPRWWRAAAVP